MREVIDACFKVTNRTCTVSVKDRRPGDVPNMIADGSLACSELKWQPAYHDIEDIVLSTFKWMSKRKHDGLSDEK